MSINSALMHSKEILDFISNSKRDINFQFSLQDNLKDDVNTLVFFIGKCSHEKDFDILSIFCKNLKKWNEKLSNYIFKYLTENKFCGGSGRMVNIPILVDGKLMNFAICGLGDMKNLTKNNLFSIGYSLVGLKQKKIGIYLPDNFGFCANSTNSNSDQFSTFANYLAESIDYANYTFTKYQVTSGKINGLNPNNCHCQSICACAFGYNVSNCNSDSTKKEDCATKVDSCKSKNCMEVQMLFAESNDVESAENLFNNKTKNLIFAYRVCMDFGNTSPNHLYPASFANCIKELFKDIPNVEISILDEDEMTKLGMNCLLGVGRGSKRESRAVVIKYTGDKDNSDKFETAYLGKGVTFDTGGISLKPSANMDKMKFDMCGAAATVASLLNISQNKIKTNIIGMVGLVENMPGGDAQLPGDIVKSMSGKTVEILNTDAEGRLVLIDLIEYVQTSFPEIKNIITIATLTGAIGVALGNTYAGLFSNSKTLEDKLISSGEKAMEYLWPMPCNLHYLKQMTSSCADIANIATINPGFSGSSNAAAFLLFFVKNGINFAHLDIATCANLGHRDKKQVGANGFGTGILSELAKS